MYIIKTKKRGNIKIQKNTILIGENGSGKSSLIDKLNDINEIEFSGTTILFDPKIDILKVTNENLKDSVDGAKAVFKKEIEALEYHAIRVTIPSTVTSHPDLVALVSDLNTTHGKSEDIISSKLKWNVSYAINDALIKTICKFEFGGSTYDISALPSGVRKLIDIYFSTKGASTNKKLVLLDEVDNFLHPNWMRLVAEVIINLMNDENIILVISTHNQDLLYLLGDYIENLGTPKLNAVGSRDYSVQYLDWELALDFYNSFTSSTVPSGYAPLNMSDFKNKVKVRFSAEFAKALFSQSSILILVEGITDQQYFKNKTRNLVVNSFGYFNFGLMLSIIKGLNGNFNGVKIISDGDNKLSTINSSNALLKSRLIADGIQFFSLNTIWKRIFLVHLLLQD